ncbi:hypothetical protein BC343_19930 [Mucilaginibacter pedocola]|uniref:Uncharacterized protein n=1 Tax=Mucilaginibacter pedocola TaxID=1792845 RepID=A0A1S9PKL1_9SPHI|nr:hypothetical protein BC343_19930 [Mucilaginibacter pedocola]
MNVKNATPSAYNLNNVDADEISDVLVKIEKSFDIAFCDDDLKEAKTFGALCDVVVAKVKQTHADSCTTQQAFYKLRSAINARNPDEKYLVKPQTKLCDLFPRDNRIEVVADIEAEMGFHMNLLQPKPWIVWTFGLLLVASIALFWVNSTIATLALIVSIAGLRLAGRFGKELKVKTVGDLAEKIAREHYLKCRRDASSVNRAEVVQKVKDLFARDLALEPSALTKEARFA